MYVTIDSGKAAGLGFRLNTHVTAHGKMIVNEKELLMRSDIGGDTLQEKAESVGGKTMDEYETIQFITKGETDNE